MCVCVCVLYESHAPSACLSSSLLLLLFIKFGARTSTLTTLPCTHATVRAVRWRHLTRDVCVDGATWSAVRVFFFIIFSPVTRVKKIMHRTAASLEPVRAKKTGDS